MTSDPRDGAGVDSAPATVNYRLGLVTIDGPALPAGTSVSLRLFGTVGHHDERPSVPLAALHIDDWAGPWREPSKPLAIAPHILDAAAAAIVAEGARIDPGGDYSDVARDLARAAIAAVSRRIQPTNDEAAAMVLGVLRLDVEKLTKTGDEIVSRLGDHPSDGDTPLADAVAVWRGVAHNDWAAHHARRAGEASP